MGGCEKIPDASVSNIQVFERERERERESGAFVWGVREIEGGRGWRMYEIEWERERERESDRVCISCVTSAA